jgi:ribonuclease BN (tRNA processing enzyme)
VRRLTVLGCDGSWPGPGGAGSGYLVRVAHTSILLDAGPGTFAQLQRHADPGDITAVVLTHIHPDHWTDLESFATWAGFGPGRERFGGPGGRPLLPIFAPPGVRERSHFAAAPWLDWRELAPSMVLSLGDLEARFGATDHGTPTLAVHLSHEGATLAYSADSGPGWSVEELGSAIGTFLCEATYTQELEGSLLHLSGREAGAMARAAGVGRLILTHRWPTVSADDVRREAELAFGQPVEQASMGAVFAW